MTFLNGIHFIMVSLQLKEFLLFTTFVITITGISAEENWLQLTVAYGGALQYEISTESVANVNYLINVVLFKAKMLHNKQLGENVRDVLRRSAEVRSWILLYSTDMKSPVMVNYNEDDFMYDDNFGPFVLGYYHQINLAVISSNGMYNHRFGLYQTLLQDEMEIFQHSFYSLSEALSSNISPPIAFNSHKGLQSRTVSHTNHQNYSRSLSVMTFNIWNIQTVGHKTLSNYQKRLQVAAKMILSVSPDVLALQEVRFDDTNVGQERANQIKELAQLLPGYQFIFQPAQIFQADVPIPPQEGVAIMSRLHISSSEYFLLTRNPRDNADIHQRILQRAAVMVPNIGQVHILNTHLPLSHIARQRNVKEIWHVIQQLNEPVIFAGDLNAEAHNDEVKFLSGEITLKGERTRYLVDTWKERHGSMNKGFTFSCLDDQLTKRIDLIYMKEHKQIQLEDVQLVDDGFRRETAGSDHIGVIAHFRLYSSEAVR